MTPEEIKKMVPEDFSFNSARPLSLYSASVLGAAYPTIFWDVWGVGFTATLWIIQGRNTFSFYRSAKEQETFNETMGKKFKDVNAAKDAARTLREYTDRIDRILDLIKKPEDLFTKWFIKTYQEFFAYHQGVYYGAEWLLRQDHEPETIKELQEAYAYNEHIVPRVDDYLAKHNKDHVHWDEPQGEIKSRGMLFRKGQPEIDLFEPGLSKLIAVLTPEIDSSVASCTGRTAFGSGKIIGKPLVIKEFDHLHAVPKDSIIVVHQTRPNFNHALQHCKAIITEDGGQLCHAAILAREHEIPCIVGTKIATKIFANQDTLEIDLDKSTVKKL